MNQSLTLLQTVEMIAHAAVVEGAERIGSMSGLGYRQEQKVEHLTGGETPFLQENRWIFNI